MAAGQQREDFAQRIADEQHGGEHRHGEQQGDKNLADQIFLKRFQRRCGAQSDGFAALPPVKIKSAANFNQALRAGSLPTSVFAVLTVPLFRIISSRQTGEQKFSGVSQIAVELLHFIGQG